MCVFGLATVGFAGRSVCRFDFTGLGFNQFDQMIDQALVVDLVIGNAAQINEMRAIAATGETNVGFAGLTGGR